MNGATVTDVTRPNNIGGRVARYVDRTTLRNAIAQLKGTAGPFFPNWLVLKQMGFSERKSVDIDTQNSTDALTRLFSYGSPEKRFYFPMAHTKRFMTRAADSSRSVVQTNIRQWFDGSGTKSPKGYLDIHLVDNSSILRVSANRNYPAGLGIGQDGMATADGVRVAMPRVAWAVWYGRAEPIPDKANPADYLVSQMLSGLGISEAEAQCVFVDGDLSINLADTALKDSEIFSICNEEAEGEWEEIAVSDTPEDNRERVSLSKTFTTGPGWLNQDPVAQLNQLLSEGNKAILLTGAPRTGKTRALKNVLGKKQVTAIQVHDGWGYDQLVLSQTLKDNSFTWEAGALLKAIRNEGDYIVLEEINRTRLSQALGEVFSLLEATYRGPSHSLTLRDGSQLYIPVDTVFLFTMNTIDKSTQDIDDALFGRLRAVEFTPRVEDLTEILTTNGITDPIKSGLLKFFNGVQRYYPLGHGYFSELHKNTDLVSFYLSAIRPVIANHFAAFEPETLEKIDNLFDEVVVHSSNA
jgi:hypothetical protein